MKKIFYFVAALAVLAVGFTGCKKDKEKEPEPEVTNPKLVITVDSITATSAFVAVVPEVDTLPYYFTYYEASDLEGLTDKEIIDQYLIGEMDYAIEYYAENYSYTLTYEDLLSVGEDSYGFSFDPNTDYVVLAAYIDAEGNVIYGDLFKKAFKTPEVEMVDLTFTFERTGNDAILVTPSDDVNPWDYYATNAEELAEFDNDTTALVEAVIDYYGSDYAAPGAYEFSISEDLVSEAGDYTLLVFGNIGALNSAIASYNFSWDGVAAGGDDDVEPLPARKVQAKKTASIKNLKGAEKVKGFKALKK